MTPTTPVPPQSKGPGLPVVAMILSVIGLCFPPLLLITGALGLYGYWRGRTDPHWALRKQVTQMTMAVSAAGLLIFLGLALPSFKRRQVWVKQQECRETLGSLYSAQARLYEKEKRYTTKLEELDWKPAPGRLILRLSSEQPVEGVPALVQGEVGVHGECPACSVTMLCANQLDGDATIDTWTISTIERIGNRGEKIAGGIAWCEVDDVTQ